MAKTTVLSIQMVGTVIPFSGTTVPNGWLLCDGSTVSRETYRRLFDAIGTAHGQGNGSTTFHLPDLRGRFIRGTDDMGTGASGRDPNAGTRTAANSGGNTGNNVGSVQADQEQEHQHQQLVQQMSNTSSAPSTATESNGGDTLGYFRLQPTQVGNTGTNVPWQAYDILERLGNGTPRVTNQTRPLNINMNYIIKV
jgi:microcystin-dependent protein